MGKFHLFDIDVAEKYGINAAILLYHISHWIDKNRANGRNYHDGEYWTYNSREAFLKLFPYMTDWQVRSALQTLIDDGILNVGNYNQVPYDRTKWYSLSAKGRAICDNRNIDLRYAENPLEENDSSIGEILQPIPDNIPDNKPNNKQETLSKDKVCSADAQRVIDAWNVLPSVPKVRRLMPTSNRYKMLTARIRDYGIDDVLLAVENVKNSPFLLGDNRRNWQIDFDWFVKPNNFPKVLDGNYTKGGSAVAEETSVPKRRLTAEEVDNMEGYY